jgi:hypothetical protein
LDVAMPWWVIPYVAGTLALSAWSHRHALRRCDAAALLSWTELLGSLCLALPGLAYWGLDIVGFAGRTALAVLLWLGAALVAAYLVFNTLHTWRNPRLSRRQRWIVGGLGIAMALLGNGLDAWWGAQALAQAGK